MNQDNLERALGERSPKEVGSGLRPLPADLHAAREELVRLGRGRGMRTVLATGAALAGVAAVSVGLAIALTRPAAPPSGGVGSEATPTPTPIAVQPCDVESLEATAEAWGGAAGSRGTTIAVRNIGSTTCTLSGQPGAAIYTGGEDVVHVMPRYGAGVPSLDLEPGDAAVTSVVWSNWCGDGSIGPDSLSLIIGQGGLLVTPDAQEPEILVPPCMGQGDPTSLSTIVFQRP